MKTLLTSFFSLLLLLAFHAAPAQTIRRCNNVGVTGAGIFATLQAAHDAAASNDIIYLEPSGISYGSLICVKPLTILGNGYLHGEQAPPLTVDPRASVVDDITFRAGSEGARLAGISTNSRVMINANNITVERNSVGGSGINLGADEFITGTQVAVTTGLIRQNFINADLTFRPSSSSTIAGVLISNNLILGNITGGNSNRVNSVLIANNVLGNRAGTGSGSIDVDNCVLKNNIVTRATATFALRANASSNNLGTGTQFGTANGNQQNVALGSIFGSATGTETAFQIAVGGPADNTGESGVDCGAFGAATPYVLTGLPNVPTIFEYSQSISGATLNATISTRSNK